MGSGKAPELLLAAFLLGAGGTAAAASSTIYCCREPDGRQICGDVLPPSCYAQGHRELSSSGVVRKNVPPPLTSAERARLDEEARLRRESSERERAQQLRDQALLATYSNLDDLERRRDHALREATQDLERARRGMAELIQRRAEAIESNGTTPRERWTPVQINTVRSAEMAVTTQQSVVDAKTRQLEAVRGRFEEDRKRYLEIAPQPR